MTTPINSRYEDAQDDVKYYWHSKPDHGTEWAIFRGKEDASMEQCITYLMGAIGTGYELEFIVISDVEFMRAWRKNGKSGIDMYKYMPCVFTYVYAPYIPIISMPTLFSKIP